MKYTALLMILLALPLGLAAEEIIVYNSNARSCDFLEAPLGEICHVWSDEGQRTFDYDTQGRIEREIVVDHHENYLMNPSFEFPSGNAANYWDFYGDLTSSEFSTDARTGAFSARIVKTASSASFAGVQSERIYVQPNTEYILRAYVKGTISAGSLSVHCRDEGVANNFQYSSTSTDNDLSDAPTWTERSLGIVTNGQADYCVFFIYFSGGSGQGDLLIDDVQFGPVGSSLNVDNTFVTDYSYDDAGNLVRVIDPANTVASYTLDGTGLARGVSINDLLVNGGFEHGLSSSTATGWEGTYSRSTTNPASGTYSGELSSGEYISQIVPVRSGLEYEMNLSMQSSGSTYSRSLTGYDENMQATGWTVSSTSGFSGTQLNNYLFEAIPADVRYVDFRFTSLSGTVYVDDVSLSPRFSTVHEVGASYTPSGLVEQIDYGFTTTDYTYYPDNLVESIVTNGGAWFDEQYSYDAAGNLVETRIGSETAQFEYDYAHRLIQATYSPNFFYGVFSGVKTWVYDRVGNILSVSEGASSDTYAYSLTTSQTFSTPQRGGMRVCGVASAMNQFCREEGFDSGSLSFVNGGGSCAIYTGSWSSAGGTYGPIECTGQTTPVGNRLAQDGDGWTYTYSDTGKVTQKVLGGTTVSFDYNANDQVSRISDNQGGADVLYYYFGDQLQRSTINGSLANIYIYGPSGALMYVQDHFNFVVAACDTTAFNYGGKTLRVRSGGTTQAIVDNQGFMKLTGQVFTGADLSSVSGPLFAIRGTGGSTVAAVDTSGNLYLAGTLQENLASIVPAGANNFIIQRSSDNVFVIDGAGSLQLKGCVEPAASILE